MIVCGWCHSDTAPGRCSPSGREPALPWLQRATEPPVVTEAERHRRLLTDATAALRAEGADPTTERLAEHLGIDPRTIRRWRAVSA
jgi:methylphosphotriester-DNA--protein-cysteine methyltransferase